LNNQISSDHLTVDSIELLIKVKGKKNVKRYSSTEQSQSYEASLAIWDHAVSNK